VSSDPLTPQVSTPPELRDRLEAEGRGNAFLLYRDGEGRQVIFELEDGRDRVAIGRRTSSDVPLAWDPEVSRIHAALERLGDAWVLSDEGLSHNGSWVNGERVHGRRRLRGGDVLSIGGTLIAYWTPGGASVHEPTRTALQAGMAVAVTPAQRRVLLALCRPLAGGRYTVPASNRQIAEELVLTVDTVKGALTQLFEAFGLEDVPPNQKRAALALRALEGGVVRRDEL
jgi:pSer/pThr/pTyr-binding forkhead associated (FHA) protein